MAEKIEPEPNSPSPVDAATSFADWVPTAEERNDMIEVSAYHIAERSRFTLSPQSCWAAAEEQIDLMFALKESKKKLQILVDTALDAVVMIDANGRVTGWNPQATRIFGWTREEILGRPVHDFIIPPEHRQGHALGIDRFLTAGGAGRFLNRIVETTALHRDGHEFPVELAIAAVMADGKPEFNAFIRDITERKRAESELREMATTDYLTGLANRRHFIARMTEEMARLQRRHSSHTAVLALDLDHFKHVNDTHGHATGDALLKHFAALVRGELRKIDTVGRIGGEEFAIILPGATVSEARGFAERLRQKVASTSMAADGTAISITVSIGVAAMQTNDVTADTALIRADEALYRAKRNGRNRVEVELDAGDPQ